MSDAGDDFFMFLGSTMPEASRSKLKVSGIPYKWKRLESSVENWEKILDHLKDQRLVGVVAKLTSHNISTMAHDTYRPLAEALFRRLGEVRCIVFVHESILAPVEGNRPIRLAAKPSRYAFFVEPMKDRLTEEQLDDLASIRLPDGYSPPTLTKH